MFSTLNGRGAVEPARATLNNASMLAETAFEPLKDIVGRHGNKTVLSGRAKGEEMTMKRDNHPSNKGYFIFAGGCALAAIVLVALLIHGEVQGPRVAPDIQPRTKILD